MPSLPATHRTESSQAEESDDLDTLNEVIMAIEMKDNNTIGCAYYVALEETLCLQEDIPMAGIEVIETLLLQATPTTIIINNRAPAMMAEYLEAHAQDLEGSQVAVAGGLNGVYILRTIGASDFNPAKGQQKLASLDSAIFGEQMTVLNAVGEVIDDSEEIGDMDTTRQSKLMRLSTVINLDSHLSIGCAGAVLKELHRRRFVQYLPDDPAAELAFRVKRVTMFTLGNSMFVNADTLVSLQILGSEHHPNSQMQGSNMFKQLGKEDLSVYGLVKTLACTPQGKMKLRQMFLRPSNDLELIRERHHTIGVLLRPGNKPIVEEVSKALSKVKNLRATIANLSKGVHQTTRAQRIKNGVWVTLMCFTHAAIELCGLVQNLSGGESLNIASKIMTGINFRGLHEVGRMIAHDIDFEQSKENQRTIVKTGIDAELDQHRHLFDGLGDLLGQVRARLLQVVPEPAHRYINNLIYFPQLGFLVSVAENPETGTGFYQGEGLVDDEWVSMFTTNDLVLYKTRMMSELDTAYGDPYGKIIDREIELVHELGVRVLEHTDTLIKASDLFGELDSLLALAMAAEKYDWKAPTMTLSNTINIVQGRHPLQELVTPSFIPNPCQIAGGLGTELNPNAPHSSREEPDNETSDLPSMLALTGPNHSGKSIYLKQNALIVYLAHVGSFVPADRAVIGLTDKILTRISTRESMARGESAFAIDLRQAAFSINHTSRRSLVLIDEFGKGTNAADGAGLMAALLEHFLSRGEDRPKVLVATHFHEIFEGGFLEEGDGLAFAHMEVRLDDAGAAPEGELTYLFRLRPGRSTSSYGCRCAVLNGVDGAVVERAEALALLSARGEDLRAACARLAPEEEKRLEIAESIARRFVEMDIPAGRLGDGTSIREWLGELLACGEVAP